MVTHAGPVGQLVMLTLLVFSIASWTIVIMKARLFKKVRVDSEDFIESFWNSANLSEANSAAAEYEHSPQAAVFIAGFSELQKINKIRNRKDDSRGPETLDMQLATMDNLKRAVRKAATQKLSLLSSSLPFLATTGSATPFIGLFGTVWGIMSTFQAIGATGSTSITTVAPGIAEALVNTAAGLLAAIPAVIAYHHLLAKVRQLRRRMDDFALEFLNLVERNFM
jgi:biopolymer transport protein TolQ